MLDNELPLIKREGLVKMHNLCLVAICILGVFFTLYKSRCLQCDVYDYQGEAWVRYACGRSEFEGGE